MPRRPPRARDPGLAPASRAHAYGGSAPVEPCARALRRNAGPPDGDLPPAEAGAEGLGVAWMSWNAGRARFHELDSFRATRERLQPQGARPANRSSTRRRAATGFTMLSQASRTGQRLAVPDRRLGREPPAPPLTGDDPHGQLLKSARRPAAATPTHRLGRVERRYRWRPTPSSCARAAHAQPIGGQHTPFELDGETQPSSHCRVACPTRPARHQHRAGLPTPHGSM